MSVDCIDTLLAVLRRTGVFGPEQIDEIVRELVPFYQSPVDLGQYLVEIDWLTAYQLQLLLAGHWDEMTVGPYQILDKLGEGGISEVFKAWDTVRGRVVALKVLRPHLANITTVVTQFHREMQAIRGLSHPNIIKTLDAHQSGKLHFFAMEFIEGMDLDRFVNQVGPLPVEQACDFVRQVAQGLQHAHQHAVVHRDIKPANLFLLHPPLPGPDGQPPKRGPDPVVKIIDWGLARCCRQHGEGIPLLSRGQSVHEKGNLIGTADYISPEQARDPTIVDVRADLYSLGCTLFFLLTGQPPFPGTSVMQKILMHQEAEVPSLKHFRADVHDELDGIVAKMLAKDPDDRFQIPLFVVTALRRYCTPPPGTGSLLRGSANGLTLKPGSSPALPAPGTSVNLPRPGTVANLQRPATSPSLSRPGQNGVHQKG